MSGGKSPGPALKGPDRDRTIHRLSNLLTAIALCSAQAMKRRPVDDPVRDSLAQILSAAEEAMEITANGLR